MKPCFQRGTFYLPNASVDLACWAVIACDQYTSQPEYWKTIEKRVKDKPSCLHLIYPEAFLSQGDQRIQTIQQTMERYLQEGILEEKIQNGFVLLKRSTLSGDRYGLVGIIDLEAYDYDPHTDCPIRATEGTIESRIPPRVRIRQNALLELSHVMVLIDDPQKQLIEELASQKAAFPVLYDCDLMMDGGHLTGYAIQGADAEKVEATLYRMQEDSKGLFLAVGDGNHSLATAKACWEKVKVHLNDQQRANHPARFAMVELVNLHSPALIFEPIHRILFHTDLEDLYLGFEKYCQVQNIEIQQGNEIYFHQGSTEKKINLVKSDDRLPIDVLQDYLDSYLNDHPQSSIDYIHGQEAMMSLLQDTSNCGIFLDRIDKNSLFSAIMAGGVLPRKTFSMGEADEKRFYMEARKVR